MSRILRAIGCLPTVPTSPITGIGVVDSLLWTLAIGTGQVKFPLFANFLKVPTFGTDTGYTFGPDTPDYADSAASLSRIGLSGYDDSCGSRRAPQNLNAVGQYDI